MTRLIKSLRILRKIIKNILGELMFLEMEFYISISFFFLLLYYI